MTHLEAIQTHIEASNPCTLKSVIGWSVSQGFGGSKMIKAIQTLMDRRIIKTTQDEDGLIVELI